MLQDLPQDCLRLIIGHLPTASSICNLASTSRHFHNLISVDDHGIYRDFVQNRFPSIPVTASWREAAISLTSRTRAWNRQAFIARECWNPKGDWKSLNSASRHGFVPAIDSYEITSSSKTTASREVLTHSAGGRIMIRRNRVEGLSWIELKSENDEQPDNDVLDLRLLRPHQQPHPDRETLIYQRANGEVAQRDYRYDGTACEPFEYAVSGADVDCIALNNERNASLAICSGSMMYVYKVQAEDEPVEPPAMFQLEDPSDVPFRRRCARYMSSNTVATGHHYLAGRDSAFIQIFDVNTQSAQDGVSKPIETLEACQTIEMSRVRQGLNAISPLADASGKPGNLLLSGWTDGVVRLYDLRASRFPTAIYRDNVDDGQVLSLLPIGNERFLAGSHQNACLKTFDFRNTGYRPALGKQTADEKRGVNIFVAPPITDRPYSWHPVGENPHYYHQRYRGPVYSLSSPSPSSATVYAGITNHVIQIDAVSTDDLVKRPRYLDPLLHLTDTNKRDVIDLSCYERPRDGFVSTDPVLLRKQRSWKEMEMKFTASMKADTQADLRVVFDAEDGWDERWHPPAKKGDGDPRWGSNCGSRQRVKSSSGRRRRNTALDRTTAP